MGQRSDGRGCSRDGGRGNQVLKTRCKREHGGFKGLQTSSSEKSPSQEGSKVFCLGDCSTRGSLTLCGHEWGDG